MLYCPVCNGILYVNMWFNTAFETTYTCEKCGLRIIYKR